MQERRPGQTYQSRLNTPTSLSKFIYSVFMCIHSMFPGNQTHNVSLSLSITTVKKHTRNPTLKIPPFCQAIFSMVSPSMLV